MIRLCSEGACELLVPILRNMLPNDPIVLVSGFQAASQPAFAGLKNLLRRHFNVWHYRVESMLPSIEELDNYHKGVPFTKYTIIAVGGGRVLDFGKLISLRLSRHELAIKLTKEPQTIQRRTTLVSRTINYET